MLGFSTAASEITLVLFTTLAPSGATAFAIVALLLASGRVEAAATGRVKQFLCIPLVISMVGLIASATHLGNPSNALYVFMGVGRSPLSNEVFSAIVFLGLAGMYWLYSFTEKQRPRLERVWLFLCALSAVVFVVGVAFAYSVETIITWDSPLMPLALCLNALVGGPLLALLSLRIAEGEHMPPRAALPFCVVSACALVANAGVLALYGSELSGMGNSMTVASSLASPFWAFAVTYEAFAALGILLVAIAQYRAVLWDEKRVRLLMASGCAVAFAGIFVIRFAFYMLHMTVGLAV